MIKTIASIFLFFFRLFGVAVLVLLPDLLVYSSFSVQQGVVPTGKMLVERGLFILSVTAPVIFFFTLTAGNLFLRKKTVAEKAVETGLSAMFAAVSLVLFLRFADAASGTHPLLFSDYCLAGTAADFSFPESFGIPFSSGVKGKSVLLFPFEAFSQTGFYLAGINSLVFSIYGVSLFFLAAVCVKFCCVSRWPLFNLSLPLFALYFFASVQRIWFWGAGRPELTPALFAAGAVVANLLPAAGMAVAIWRRSRDSLF